ncbi:hypothetical protein BSG1_16835 [Bacillus sp. SG-1]|nr:hypothetical protein BSG1_16835 [Bacillus sp. SG-1]
MNSIAYEQETKKAVHVDTAQLAEARTVNIQH